MKILFGPYGSVLPTLGVSSDVLRIACEGHQQRYKLAVEMIASGYINAGATIPTINAFFLRPVLHEGFVELFKEILTLNVQALLAALHYQNRGGKPRQIALCLGPSNDCYMPQVAPDIEQACSFHEKQYELCLEVLRQFGFSSSDIMFLHETIGTQREALGLNKAARSLGIPLTISFIVGDDGHLISGESVEQTIKRIDDQTSGLVKGFSLNCCSPYALDRVAATFQDKKTLERIVGFYPNSYDANPSTYESGATLLEVPKKESLKIIVDKGREYGLQFVGGCCGFGYHDIKMLAELADENYEGARCVHECMH